MTKILAFDIDNNKEKSHAFFNAVEQILGVELIQVPIPKIIKYINTAHRYDKFVEASFALEEYVIDHEEYFSPQKPFINAIFAFGDYSIKNIECIKPYNEIFDKELIIFQEGYNNQESHWVYGNIIAMLKWSSSLYKINFDWFPTSGRDALFNITFLNAAIWYANRIGLNVKGI